MNVYIVGFGVVHQNVHREQRGITLDERKNASGNLKNRKLLGLYKSICRNSERIR